MRLPRAMLVARTGACGTEADGAEVAAPGRRPHQAAARPGTRTRSRSTRSSAIWTPFVAAPLRRLSETIHSASPFRRDGSRRMRPTRTSSVRRLGGERVLGAPWSSIDPHPGRGPQDLARLVGLERRVRLDPHGLGVPAPDRHAHTGRMDPDRVVTEDLLRLEHELRLLQRAIPLEALALRNRVERDRMRVHHRLGCVVHRAQPGDCDRSSSTALAPVPDTAW